MVIFTLSVTINNQVPISINNPQNLIHEYFNYLNHKDIKSMRKIVNSNDIISKQLSEYEAYNKLLLTDISIEDSFNKYLGENKNIKAYKVYFDAYLSNDYKHTFSDIYILKYDENICSWIIDEII